MATKQTKELIKNTFMSLLEHKNFIQITVTEICKIAKINRGTFYLHYYDINDVLDEILDELFKNTSTMLDHVFCLENNCTYPFCDKIQNDKRHKTLFMADIISAKILNKLATMQKESYVNWILSHSHLTSNEAEALFYFQMNGCLTINKFMLQKSEIDWKKIRTTIDTFIKSGLEGIVNAN